MTAVDIGADAASPEYPLASAVSGLTVPPLSASFHHSIRVKQSEDRGVHLFSTEPIPAHEPIARIPFASTLSVLSISKFAAHWPTEFLNAYSSEPEVLTRLLICHEKLRGQGSPWYSYISLLPVENGTEFNTPLFWPAEDLEWLSGTNLGGATEKRLASWRDEWQRLLEVSRDTKLELDSNTYTFELYMWASTVLSSRSFTQEVLRGWSGHEESSGEFSRSILAQRWKDRDPGMSFPVLLPGIDLANHDRHVKAIWTPGNGEIVLSHEREIPELTEVCNNYGPKGNEELMLGYGFMLEENNADFVMLLTSATNSHSAEVNVTEPVSNKALHPQATKLFIPEGDDPDRPDVIVQRSLPESDIEQLLRKTSNTRELSGMQRESRDLNLVPPPGVRCLNIMVDGFVLSLENRRDRLNETKPTKEPTNHREELARKYRDSQIAILEANIDFLTDYLSSLSAKGRVLTLHKLLSDTEHPQLTKPLLSLLADFCGTKPKAKSIRARGLHEFAFTLWICSVRLLSDSGSIDDQNLVAWIKNTREWYNESGNAADQNLKSLLDGLKAHSESDPQGLFADSRWTEDLLAWGLQVWREESIVLKSMNRIVRNNEHEEHEDMLFLESYCN